MQTVGSVASIIAAIREDCAAEVERLDRSIAEQVEALRKEQETTSVAVADRESRLAAARRENQERVAQQEWEGRRAEIEQREAWIARVVAKAHDAWKPSREQLDALIHEATQNLGAAESEIKVIERDGGCVVTAGDMVFDNTLDARSQRLEAEWRKALSEVYRP
ncbi:MAG TPA: hypothetical protein VL284_05605 [Thermoanaerobaculia bacterium]|nr:hypothetical protein [Thermoanaerobaculia bacterium]